MFAAFWNYCVERALQFMSLFDVLFIFSLHNVCEIKYRLVICHSSFAVIMFIVPHRCRNRVSSPSLLPPTKLFGELVHPAAPIFSVTYS